jgi:hypothetical protein
VAAWGAEDWASSAAFSSAAAVGLSVAGPSAEAQSKLQLFFVQQATFTVWEKKWHVFW